MNVWLLRQLVKTIIFGRPKRNEGKVAKEYAGRWSETRFREEARLQIKNGREIWCLPIDHQKSFILYIDSVIKELRPKRVVELGSGDGLNLACLSIMNPDIEFTGLELTREGVEWARQVKNKEDVRYITGREGVPKATFIQGNMLRAPFANKEFDLAFTCQAIEQIPAEYKRAFEESSRIAQHSLHLEGFSEAQTLNSKIRLYLKDYFRWSFRSHPGKLLRFESMNYQKMFYVIAALLTRND